MAKIEPYEKHADAYDDWYSRNRSAYESELEAIGRLLPKKGTGVEVGVGTGRFAVKFGIPIGVEPSMAMGKIARERGIAVIRGVAEALPIREGRFDFVLMVTTLCFFDDVEGAMREAHRVLAPAGSLVIGMIDRESPLGKGYSERVGCPGSGPGRPRRGLLRRRPGGQMITIGFGRPPDGWWDRGRFPAEIRSGSPR